jgi:hypothetical protein
MGGSIVTQFWHWAAHLEFVPGSFSSLSQTGEGSSANSKDKRLTFSPGLVALSSQCWNHYFKNHFAIIRDGWIHRKTVLALSCPSWICTWILLQSVVYIYIWLFLFCCVSWKHPFSHKWFCVWWYYIYGIFSFALWAEKCKFGKHGITTWTLPS